VKKQKTTMARVKNNDLTKGLTGKFGDIMFRQIGRRTYAFPAPRRPKKESEKQRSNRNKFKEATQFAQLAMKDEARKAYYKKLAKKLKLPNAYTAAITDYMRKPEITSVQTKHYNGKPGGEIGIFVDKKGIELEKVNVTISSSHDEVIEYGAASRSTISGWTYKSKLTTPSPHASYRMMITATDAAGHSVDKIIQVDRVLEE
jgi:hypothetical protein